MQQFGVSSSRFDQAVQRGLDDTLVAARDVAAWAADHGVPLREVLDHVERIHEVAGREVPVALVRAVAESWADGTGNRRVDLSCENPISSLAGLPHLRARLTELYRRATRDQGEVVDGLDHALVAIELVEVPSGNELEVELRALEVADALREVFTGDETFVQLAARRFAVLVDREVADPVTVHLVTKVLTREVRDGLMEPPRVWVENLPTTADGMHDLLVYLSL